METDPRTEPNPRIRRRSLPRKLVLGLVAVVATTALAAAALSVVDREPAEKGPARTTQDSARQAVQATGAARFQIASFNLLGAGHTDGANPRRGYDKSPVRLRRALEVLTKNGIDVVGFQEMHGSQQDLWATIASPTWRTFPMNTMSDSAGHNSIGWRHDTFVSVEKHTFPVPYFHGKPIQMPYVLLKHRATGEQAWFINVHNPADTFGDAEKWRVAATRAEMALVNRLRAENPRIPVFLTGDMNERSDWICPIMKKTELESAHPGGYVSGTSCYPPPSSQIDWVTGTPDVTFWGYRALRDALVKATTDHPVIIANVDIPPRWARSRGFRNVVVISIEGLRSRTLSASSTAALVPYLRSVRAKGASTLNARTAYERTTPLPNAFSTLTGRPVRTEWGGHGITTATDPGTTAHAAAGEYVSGVFDMVHNRSLRTALYSSDPASTAMVRSWNATNGGGDNFGRDNGRAKISTVFQYSASDRTLTRRVMSDLASKPAAFSYVQMANLGKVGARYGYYSTRYKQALQNVDRYVGRILSTIKANPAIANRTLVVITSGSGGATGTDASLLRYQVPILVWGNGVQAGGDLYAMNPSWKDPGTARRDYSAGAPLFNGAIANLTLGVLGIGPLPRGVINAGQSLNVFPAG